MFLALLQGQQAEGTVLGPLQNALSTFLSFLPQLLGAIIILIIGYIVAKILQAVVGRVLRGIGFENWMEKGGIKQFFDRAQTNQDPTGIIGKLVFWFVFIIALTMAADALGIPQVSAVLAQLIAFIPSIITAILILVLAALFANFVAGIVRGATGSDIVENAYERRDEAKQKVQQGDSGSEQDSPSSGADTGDQRPSFQREV